MLYQRLPGAPPRDFFNWFVSIAGVMAIVVLALLAGGSWDRVYTSLRREASVYERCRPYSSAKRAIEFLGEPDSRVCESGLERLRYRQVDGLPGEAELWVENGHVVRLFSLESSQHNAAMEQALARRTR